MSECKLFSTAQRCRLLIKPLNKMQILPEGLPEAENPILTRDYLKYLHLRMCCTYICSSSAAQCTYLVTRGRACAASYVSYPNHVSVFNKHQFKIHSIHPVNHVDQHGVYIAANYHHGENRTQNFCARPLSASIGEPGPRGGVVSIS